MWMLDVIEEWAEEEKGHSAEERARRLARVISRIDHLRDIGYLPENFPPGDLKRSVAEAQVRAIEREAEMLGFLPPAQRVAMEAGKEVARGHAGGMGLADDGGDAPSTEKKKGRERDSGLGFGPELTPWSA
ncbi:MAG: hypothetical protein ACP5M3_05170 [Acidithiobacillus sp.]